MWVKRSKLKFNLNCLEHSICISLICTLKYNAWTFLKVNPLNYLRFPFTRKTGSQNFKSMGQIFADYLLRISELYTFWPLIVIYFYLDWLKIQKQWRDQVGNWIKEEISWRKHNLLVLQFCQILKINEKPSCDPETE